MNYALQYGTTPLVWACRKGHRDIVEMLLNEHATVDNAGMVRFSILPEHICFGPICAKLHQFRVFLFFCYRTHRPL